MAPNEFGRPWTAPPGMAADRIDILRDAWSNTLKDPELVAEAKKRSWPVEPVGGEAARGAGERRHRPAAGSHRQIEKTFSGVASFSSPDYLAGRSKRNQMRGARLTDERRRTLSTLERGG